MKKARDIVAGFFLFTLRFGQACIVAAAAVTA
jgi:hypothetical protein